MSSALSEQYSAENDLSLITLYRNGDKSACATLIVRYASLINSRASRYKIVGADVDDVRQEAYMGLLGAIRSFESSRNVSFSTYATNCVNNKLKNFLAHSTTKKEELNNNFVSFENDIEESSDGKENSQNPEAIFIQNEGYVALMGLIDQHLSTIEKEVLFLYLNGYNYKAVAEKLGADTKSVDNALQRARKKLKAVLNSL